MPQARGRRSDHVVDFDRLDVRSLRFRPGRKWSAGPPDVLPAWIADMDFPIARPILASLRSYIDIGDFGYPHWPNGASPLRNAYSFRMKDRYGWRPDPAYVREFTDIIYAVHLVLELTTKPGDRIAMHTPGYGPFVEVIERTGRQLTPLPMVESPFGWTFDPEDCAQRVRDAGCRVLILVNPHNPTGRVFTREELLAIAEMAERHDLLVISDDLHADLVYPPHRHIPFASLDRAIEARTVTMYSASKAFSLAGLRCAIAHIGVPALRAALAEKPPPASVNVLGMRATLAAWAEGNDWLDNVVDYLDGNRRLVAEVIAQRLPQVRHHPPEATYLAWLDCRQLGWGANPAERFQQQGRVWLSPGHEYNPGGDGFVRLNFATARPVLQEILDRMAATAESGARQKAG